MISWRFRRFIMFSQLLICISHASSPCYVMMIKITTRINHNIFTINIIKTATTNIVITIIAIDQCCWDSAVWRRILFDQFLAYCSKASPWPVCVLYWVKYVFSIFSFTCRCLPCCFVKMHWVFNLLQQYPHSHLNIWSLPCSFVKMHRVFNLLQRLQTVHPAATSPKHKAEPPAKYDVGIL